MGDIQTISCQLCCKTVGFTDSWRDDPVFWCTKCWKEELLKRQEDSDNILLGKGYYTHTED